MKKVALFSLVVSSLMLQAGENIFYDGKASGQARLFYIDREYQGSGGNKTHRGSTSIGGYLKYETAPFSGLNLGAAFYTTNEIHSRETVDQTLFGPNNKNTTYLGEAYLNYKYANTNFKAGRQKLSTPMIGDDDARMLPNLFEAYVLTNSDIKNLHITLAHVSKEAQGSFGRSYNAGADKPNAVLSVTSGYSYVDSLSNATKFTNMGKYAFGKKTDGVTMLGLKYSASKYLSFELWDYYAYDIANIIYAEALANWECLLSDSITPYAGVQYIREDNIGDDIAGKIKSDFIATKLGFKFTNFDLMFAYSHTGSNSNKARPLERAIVSPWGGMSAYTQGMVTRHQFMAGVDAKKVALSYNSKDLGLNLTSIGYYTHFEMDGKSGYGISRDASEAGFDFIYNPEALKNLNLRLRGNFPRNYANGGAGKTGWNEYRFIVNYNF